MLRLTIPLFFRDLELSSYTVITTSPQSDGNVFSIRSTHGWTLVIVTPVSRLTTADMHTDTQNVAGNRLVFKTKWKITLQKS
jgi:flagellar hook-associated protein FlgK